MSSCANYPPAFHCLCSARAQAQGREAPTPNDIFPGQDRNLSVYDLRKHQFELVHKGVPVPSGSWRDVPFRPPLPPAHFYNPRTAGAPP